MPQWLVIGISGVTCGGKTTLAHSLRDYFHGQRHRSVQLFNTPYTMGDVQLISQDDYFLPVDDLRHKWNDKLNAINFELITSLDMKQMLSDITWTMKGRYLAGDPLDNIDYINEMAMSTNFEHYAIPAAQTQAQHNHFMHQNQFSQNLSQRQANAAHMIRVNSQVTAAAAAAAAQLRTTKINILIIEGFMIFNQPELLALCNIKFHFHLPYEKCYERRRQRTYDPPDVVGYFEICVWPHYERNFAEFRERKDVMFLNGDIGKEKMFKFVLQRIIAYFEERCDLVCPPAHKLLGMPSCINGHSIGVGIAVGGSPVGNGIGGNAFIQPNNHCPSVVEQR